MSNDREQRRAIDKKRRQAVRQRIKDIKDVSSCVFCGEGYPACLEFHHKNPLEKEIAISNIVQSRSIQTLNKELEKCVVLCGNCHRKLHDIIDLDGLKDLTKK